MSLFFVKQRTHIAQVASWVIILASCSVLLGWVLDLGMLKGTRPNHAAMRPVTAFAFCLTGFSLWLQTRAGSYPWARRQRMARSMAVVVGLTGLFSLAKSALNPYFQLDGLSSSQNFLSLAVEMSPVTAWNFVLVGCALFLVDRNSGKIHSATQYLALAVALLGLVALAGYIYGVQGLYRTAGFSTVALHTAVLFIVTSMGLFFARPHMGPASVITSEHAGGWMARRILPITTCLPFVIGWLRMYGERIGFMSTSWACRSL